MTRKTLIISLSAFALLYIGILASASAGDDHKTPEPSPTPQSIENASETLTEVHTHYLGLSMVGPEPAPVRDCYIPKKRMGRGFRAVFGLWEMSAVVERDPQCIQDQINAANRELERIKALTALEQARAERIKAESCRECEIQK